MITFAITLYDEADGLVDTGLTVKLVKPGDNWAAAGNIELTEIGSTGRYYNDEIDTDEEGYYEVWTDKTGSGADSGLRKIVGKADNDAIQDDAVEDNTIKDGEVVHSKLAADAVEEENIKDDEVATDKIPDNAITTDKIVDDAVTTDKIVDDAVTTDKIVDDAVTTDKIVDDAVTTDKIVDDAVTTDKIVDDAVETAKIKDANVTEEKLSTLVSKEWLLNKNYAYTTETKSILDAIVNISLKFDSTVSAATKASNFWLYRVDGGAAGTPNRAYFIFFEDGITQRTLSPTTVETIDDITYARVEAYGILCEIYIDWTQLSALGIHNDGATNPPMKINIQTPNMLNNRLIFPSQINDDIAGERLERDSNEGLTIPDWVFAKWLIEKDQSFSSDELDIISAIHSLNIRFTDEVSSGTRTSPFYLYRVDGGASGTPNKLNIQFMEGGSGGTQRIIVPTTIETIDDITYARVEAYGILCEAYIDWTQLTSLNMYNDGLNPPPNEPSLEINMNNSLYLTSNERTEKLNSNLYEHNGTDSKIAADNYSIIKELKIYGEYVSNLRIAPYSVSNEHATYGTRLVLKVSRPSNGNWVKYIEAKNIASSPTGETTCTISFDQITNDSFQNNAQIQLEVTIDFDLVEAGTEVFFFGQTAIGDEPNYIFNKNVFYKGNCQIEPIIPNRNSPVGYYNKVRASLPQNDFSASELYICDHRFDAVATVTIDTDTADGLTFGAYAYDIDKHTRYCTELFAFNRNVAIGTNIFNYDGGKWPENTFTAPTDFYNQNRVGRIPFNSYFFHQGFKKPAVGADIPSKEEDYNAVVSQLRGSQNFLGKSFFAAAQAITQDELIKYHKEFLVSLRSVASEAGLSYYGVSRKTATDIGTNVGAYEMDHDGQMALKLSLSGECQSSIDLDDNTAFAADIATITSALGAALTAGGWFSHFLHIYVMRQGSSVYSSETREMRHKIDEMLSTYQTVIEAYETANSAIVYRATMEQAIGYKYFRDLCQAVSGIEDSGVIYVTLELQDEYPEFRHPQHVNEPVSIYVDISGTALTGNDIKCDQAIGIRKVNTDIFVIDIAYPHIKEGYHTVKIETTASPEYYDFTKPTAVAALVGDTLTVTSDQDVRVALFKIPDTTTFEEARIYKRSVEYGQSHEFTIDDVGYYIAGVVNNVGVSLISNVVQLT